MNIRHLISLFLALLFCVSLHAENIDPYQDGSQYAYGENVGWLNFETNTGSGVQMAYGTITGYFWSENIGWISMSCENTGSCGTVDYGITNNGDGNLSGYAWAENVGWISFSCDNTNSCTTASYAVRIDADGNLVGWAWSENVGWIHLSSDAPVSYGVQACVVTLDDLQNFADDWLNSGRLAGNIDGSGNVDYFDFAILGSYWLDYCPHSWQLK